MTSSPVSRARAAATEAVDSLGWLRLLVDLAFVVGWTIATTVAFAGADWPAWLYYLALLGGVLAYTLASDR